MPLQNPPVMSGQTMSTNPLVAIGNGGSIKYLDETSARLLRHIFRGVDAFRGLPITPRNDSHLRKIMDIPVKCADLLRLHRFPELPRFQARADQIILRDHAYQSYTYRHFGSFQTKLQGWIRPSALEIQFDFIFEARGKTFSAFRGDITHEGPLSGTIYMEGSDAYGRKWNLRIEMKNILLRDDGYPSTGWVQIAGWDPTMKNMTFAASFPLDQGPVSAKNPAEVSLPFTPEN